MAYGILKVDTITYTDGGSDQSISVSGLVQSTSTSGDITSTGTIQAQNIIGLTTVSGATVSGDTGQFTNLTAVSGVFTAQISGATVTGNVGDFTTITAVTGIFTNTLSGTTVTGTTAQFTTLTGGTAGFTTITGQTVTGVTANFVTANYTTSVTGSTVVGTSIVSGATVTGGVIGVGTNVTFPDGTTQTTAATTTSDVATTTGIQTFTAAQRGAVVVVPYATGISLDLSSGNNYQITLTGSTTLQNPTNIVSGQAGVITIIQGTASNTMAFSTGWHYPGGSGSTPSLTATSGAVDLLVYYTKDTSSVSYRLVQDVKA
jgi:hypothetical protein